MPFGSFSICSFPSLIFSRRKTFFLLKIQIEKRRMENDSFQLLAFATSQIKAQQSNFEISILPLNGRALSDCG
jgi:hypothetical protein